MGLDFFPGSALTVRLRRQMTTLRLFFSGGASALGVNCSFAQLQPTAAPNPPANPATGGNLVSFFSNRTPYEFWLTCLICFVGLTVIIILTWSLHRMGKKIRPEDVTRPVIVITIIFGTLVLVTAGYSNEQIAPAFGLFGTIVGYILGRMSQPSPSQVNSTEESGNTDGKIQNIGHGKN